ncbi:Zinc phosphodiesterase ELAC protein 2, partial [Tetrabaena socialis]
VPLRFVFVANYILARHPDARPPLPAPAASALASALASLGLAAFGPFPVDHVADSHGLRLEGQAGWKVVFSADTRPCAQTVEAARGATLLVHEATFEEGMQGEARAKKHSTTAEAVEVGEK